MTVKQQGNDEVWRPAIPIEIDSSFVDVEWYEDGRWVAYRGMQELGRGRSRLKLVWLIWRERFHEKRA